MREQAGAVAFDVIGGILKPFFITESAGEDTGSVFSVIYGVLTTDFAMTLGSPGRACRCQLVDRDAGCSLLYATSYRHLTFL